MSSSLIVLSSVLSEKDSALQIWAKLKHSYFSVEYQPIFRSITNFYATHQKLPTKGELELSLNRAISESPIYGLFLNFEPPEDIDPLIALKILVDEYTQNSALDKIEKLVNKISELSSEEVIEKIAVAAYELEQESDIQSTIYSVQDIELFSIDPTRNYIPLGINNTMDNKIIGVARSEVVLIGGRRGSGKSLVCSNIVVNEYLNGFIAPYYTIEMRANQIHRRNIGMEAGVLSMNLRNNTLTEAEKDAIARVLCNKYVDGERGLAVYAENRDLHAVEMELKKCELKTDSQIIIVDNPHLSLVDLDTSLTRLKALYGDKIRLVAVDYLNQIKVPDKYDWQSQITISSTLKELAAKHDVVFIVPYQIDATGEARFSKGILDSADYAVILTAEQDAANPYIKFETTKARDIPPFSVMSVMDWGTLKISPTEAHTSSESGDEEGTNEL